MKPTISPRPTPGRPVPAPARSPLRAAVERASLPAITALTRLPRWLVPLLLGVCLLAGLLLPGVAGIAALAAVTLFVAWLVFLSWPAVSARGRVLRLLAVALLLWVVGTRILAG